MIDLVLAEKDMENDGFALLGRCGDSHQNELIKAYLALKDKALEVKEKDEQGI